MDAKKFNQLYRAALMLIAALAVNVFCAGQGFCAGPPSSEKERGVPEEPLRSALCNEFTFDATQSSLPQGEDVSLTWDFGDGQTSREPVVAHIYEKAGDYTVTLSIQRDEPAADDAACDSWTVTRQVRVWIPPHAEFHAPDAACAGETVVFDAAPSYDDTAKALSYLWDFGDGSPESREKEVKKVYAKGGSYKVTLTVDDHSGNPCGIRRVEKIIRVNEPPQAEAGAETLLQCVAGEEDLTVAFDASKSFDADNDALSYRWDFGDGESAQGMKVSHRYAQPGNYDVKLVVSDNTPMDCAAGVDFVLVRLNPAPVAEAGEDTVVCPGDPVELDGSRSTAERKGTLHAQWFFGDGQTAEGLKVTHVYDRPGRYSAALSVENQLNAMCPPSRDSRTVVVNASPQVKITSADAVCRGDTVVFHAAAADNDGDSLEYYWNFGDGAIVKDGPKVTHAYSQGGKYRVSVVVDDGTGTNCATAAAVQYIKVNTPPAADPGENKPCCVGKEAEFDAGASTDPDEDILRYRWDFGDGIKAEGVKVKHTYTQSGSFDVTLSVDDQTGTACSVATAGFTAVVKDKAVPVIQVR